VRRPPGARVPARTLRKRKNRKESPLETVTITLDGSEVSGHADMTILELAREVGIQIPTLCYDPHLSPLGACRVCIVEEETSGRLLASCVTPIAPGMVVRTRSQRVLENRRVILELMLASHPDSCIVCDKGNRCKLRQIAADLGVGMVGMERIPSYHPVVDLNPFIQRDLSKCIRCGRCIRADQEIAVVGAIDYTDRGFESRPATLLNAPLERTECNFCGICLAVCPTGALSARSRASTTTSCRATRTVCTLCGTGCAIRVEHRDGRVLGSGPAEDGRSVNHVSLCVKGHFGLDFVNSAERLASPLVRRDGRLAPADWDEALGTVAGRFAEIKKIHGGPSLGALGASRSTNEEGYLLQKFVRGVLGSPHIDSGACLRTRSLLDGIARVLGSGDMTHPISHIRRAQEILVVGADPLVESPIVAQTIKQAVKLQGACLTLVDPLPRGLAVFARTWIRPDPGTHPAFLAGLVRGMLERHPDLPGKGHAGNPEMARLMALVDGWTPDRVEKHTGIPAKLVADTAERLGGGRRLAVIPGAGVARDDHAELSGSLLALLVLLSGDTGRDGSGLYPIAGSLNDQGAADMGVCPEWLPGRLAVEDPAARAVFERAWGLKLPGEKGRDYLSMIEAAAAGEMKGLYVVGENPVRDCPGGARVRQALSRLECLVVQDLFLTETAEMAHVVLPASSFAEKAGTVTSLERRVQRLQRALEPLGQSREDGRILMDLMGRMGAEAPRGEPAHVLGEINELVGPYRGITDARLGREPEGVFRPCAGPADPDTPVLFADGPPQLPAGLDAALPAETVPRARDEYPLWLVASETLFHSADGVRTARSRALCQVPGGGKLVMNPFDAAPLGIGDGDEAVVTSPEGSLRATVAFDGEVPRGILAAACGASLCPNPLFAMASRDAKSGTPHMHRLAVRVEVAHAGED